MDETNPTDTTANRATGTNPAPASPEVKPAVTAAPPAAVPVLPVPPPPVQIPVPPPAPSVPPVQPVPAPPAPPKPPVLPIQFNVPVLPPPLPPEPARPAQAVPPPPPIQASVPRVPIQFNVPPVPPRPIAQPVPPPPPPPKPIADVPPPPAPNSSPTGGPAPVTSIEPTAQSEPVQPPKKLRDDIASIINKIKLPERITLRMSGEKSKPPPPAPVPPTAEKEPEKTAAPRPEETSAQTPSQSGNAPKEPESASSVASVHTLKDDLQSVVRDTKMSLVRAVALESEKKKGQEHLAGPGLFSDKARSHKVIGIAFVVMIFMALGLVTFFGVRSVLEQGAGTPQPAAAPSLIFAEKTLMFPQETRTGDDLKRTLMAGVRTVSNIPLGAIIHIVPTSSQTDAGGAVTEQTMGIGEFLNAIGAQATPELLRSLRGDFFLGFHQTAGKLSPVIIIPVTSYERAFAGMLVWEPVMNADLSTIFSSIPPQAMNEKGLLVQREFQDVLINNYDVRFLKDDAGATQLLYSFPTRTMLIITESPYSFTEVLSRLRASRQL